MSSRAMTPQSLPSSATTRARWDLLLRRVANAAWSLAVDGTASSGRIQRRSIGLASAFRIGVQDVGEVEIADEFPGGDGRAFSAVPDGEAGEPGGGDELLHLRGGDVRRHCDQGRERQRDRAGGSVLELQGAGEQLMLAFRQ